VLPIGQVREAALERFASWHRERMRLVAPVIWIQEVVSVVRRAIYTRLINSEDGRVAVEDVFRLGVEVVASDLDLCRQALAWAERLGQSKAYDGFYMAAAERLGAELWTVDSRLLNRARQLGVSWVKSMGS
jgi:predicted nucleic acid-binding protein